MEFLLGSSVWVYILIFFGKILEVTVSTVRIVLINRGERIRGSVIAFFEISLWLLVTGTVLAGFQKDLIRCVVFAVAFAVGNYMGSWLEDKLAFGLCSIQVIVPNEGQSEELAELLRQNNFAVTSIEGKGKDGERKLLMLHLKRKRIPKAVELINANLDNAVIVVNDVKFVKGGYIKK